MNVTIDTQYGRYEIEVSRQFGDSNENILCPRCSADRKKSKVKAATFNPGKEGGVFNCHHCGLQGHRYDPNKEYLIRPLPVTVTFRDDRFSQRWRDWLVNERKISIETAEAVGLYTMNKRILMKKLPEHIQNREKFLNTFQVVEALAALYRYRGRLIQIQYRDLFKNWAMEKDADLVFFNGDIIRENKIVVISEGWMDTAANYEAGIINSCSVPNGTTITDEEKEIFEKTGSIELKSEPVLKYLENQWDDFKDVEEVVLNTDKDAAGRKLAELLRRKFTAAGKKVSEMILPVKDSNQMLITHGKEALLEAYRNRRVMRNKELIYINHIREESERYYREGMPPKRCSGWVDFDPHFGYFDGDLIGINGFPANGKTSFVINLLLALAKIYGHKFLIYSPENYPVSRFVILFAEIYAGRSIDPGSKRSFANGPGMSFAEAMDFIHDHFVFVPMRPVPSWDKLRSFAINNGKDFRGILIDPVNRTIRRRHQYGMVISEYLQEELTEQMAFGLDTGISTFFTMHPPTQDKKMRRGNEDGSFDHPTQFEIEGGKIWMSSLQVLMTVHRPNYSQLSSKETHVYVQKLKDWKLYGRPTGEVNPVKFEMKTSIGRLYVNNQSPLDEVSAHQKSLIFNEPNYDVSKLESVVSTGPDNPF